MDRLRDEVAVRTLRVPRLWKYTAGLVFGLSLLVIGAIQGVKLLDLPGCIVFTDDVDGSSGEYDLATERYLPLHLKPNFKPNYGSAGWIAPDGSSYIYMQRENSNLERYTFYLQRLRDNFTEPSLPSLALSEGVFNAGYGASVILFSNDRNAWSDDRFAFMWKSLLDQQFYLTVVNSDGSNQRTIMFPPYDPKCRMYTPRFITGRGQVMDTIFR
jgi:hypothetical protein